MREIKRKSALPVYIAAAVFALYALIFPLYASWHFLIAAVITAAAWVIADRIIGPVTEYVPEAEPEPEPEARSEADEIIQQTAQAAQQMQALAASIAESEISQRVDTLIELSGRIAQDAKNDAADIPQIRKFQRYFLPSTIALLQSFQQLKTQVIDTDRLTAARANITEMLDTEIAAFRKQLDALYQNDFMSIDADIQVMQRLMEREGLLDDDELHRLLQTAQGT